MLERSNLTRFPMLIESDYVVIGKENMGKRKEETRSILAVIMAFSTKQTVEYVYVSLPPSA